MGVAVVEQVEKGGLVARGDGEDAADELVGLPIGYRTGAHHHPGSGRAGEGPFPDVELVTGA